MKRVREDKNDRKETKKMCRRVHFAKDVKKNDGLRADSMIFEEVSSLLKKCHLI